jgi:hypothetical protein
VTDDDYHEGQIKHVDPKTNEIFLTQKRVPMSQIVRFKRELNEVAEGEHGAIFLAFLASTRDVFWRQHAMFFGVNTRCFLACFFGVNTRCFLASTHDDDKLI